MSNIINLKPEPENPLANRLRNAVAKACGKPEANRPVEPSLIVQADAQGNVKHEPPKEIQLKPFEDGVLLRYSPDKSSKTGRVLIHDFAGQIVAVAMNEQIGDILSRGAHLIFSAAQEEIKKAKSSEETGQTEKTTV